MSKIYNNYSVTLKSIKHEYGKVIQECKKSFNIRKSAYLSTEFATLKGKEKNQATR